MAKFVYVGVTNAGKQVKGEIAAETKNEVVSLLRKKKVRPLSIKPKPFELRLRLGSGVRLQDQSRFTRQLSAMTSAGLPLVQSLDILASQTENKVLEKALQQVSLDIQGGSAFADALAKHNTIFNPLYCNMVSAGEASGNLDVVLKRLADYQEKSETLRRKIRGAMTYPAVVLFVALGTAFIMLTFVVPTFARMFTEFGGVLPVPTRVILAISSFLRSYLWLVAIGMIAAGVALIAYYRTGQGRLVIDTLQLKIPVLGDLLRKSSISRFSQTLSTLLSSGITIIEALSITAKTAGNKVLEKGLLRTLERVTGGLTIAEPLKETGVFPPMVIQMISVGEKTGDLSGMLSKVSEFYEEEVDAAVDALTSIIEPVMILFMGAIVGGILVAMYLPMFSMASVVG